jgi:hypothetical protein
VPEYRALTKAEYLHTMRVPMRRLRAEESPPVVVNIRECAREGVSVLRPGLDLAAVDAALEESQLEHVYLSGDGAFTHVLLNLGEPNVFLVILIDNSKAAVHGHYRLDLKAEYGL